MENLGPKGTEAERRRSSSVHVGGLSEVTVTPENGKTYSTLCTP